MNVQKNAAFVLLIISTFFWGNTYVCSKIVLKYMSSTSLLFFRYIIAAIFLWLFMIIMNNKFEFKKEDIPRIVVSSALGINLSFYLQTIALRSISTSMAGVYNGAIPILTLIVEVLLFNKKLTKRIITAFLLSSVGIYLTMVQSNVQLNSNGKLGGHLLMIIGMLCWIMYTFITEPLSKKYSSLSILTYQIICASIIMIPFAIKEVITMHYLTLILLEKELLFNLLILGIFCSSIAYYGYVYGVTHLGPSTTSVFLNFVPIVSMIQGYLILGENITPMKTLGATLVIFSIFLINFNFSIKPSKPRKKLAFRG